VVVGLWRWAGVTGKSIWLSNDWYSVMGTRQGGGVVNPPFSRSSLVKGVDRPIRDVTTGVLPGVARTELWPANEGIYVMSPGEVLENKTIHGRVRGSLGGVLRNCRVLGTPPAANPGINQHLPLVELYPYTGALANDSSFLVEDCTLQPLAAYESPQVYGFKGGGATFRRCVIARCVDAGQAFYKTTTIEQCWVGDPTLFNYAVDPTRSDGDGVHSDGTQWEGGSGMTLTLSGNNYNCSVPGLLTTNGTSVTCFLNTANVGTPTAGVLTNNWFDGGGVSLNLAANPSSGFTVTGNRIRVGQLYPIHIKASAAVQAGWTLSGNVDLTAWEADPLTSTGITYST
jgi:hypothetical protein